MTHPDLHQGKKLIRKALKAKVIACGNVIKSEVTSFFYWDKRLSEETESLIIFKTTPIAKNACLKFLKKNHPYSCPEILFIKISQGNQEYLKWVHRVCTKRKS